MNKCPICNNYLKLHAPGEFIYCETTMPWLNTNDWYHYVIDITNNANNSTAITLKDFRVRIFKDFTIIYPAKNPPQFFKLNYKLSFSSENDLIKKINTIITFQ